MGKPVLSIRDLNVDLFRDRIAHRILHDISFDMAPGEVVALVGESGSGKSTIGLAIQGLLNALATPSISGSIKLAGQEVVDAPERSLRSLRRDRVRAISQDALSSLNPTMTIGSQMAEGANASRDTMRDWLERTGLPDPDRILGSYPHRLSGGQRQRVMIAMAMLADPALLIADEPTTALDVTVQAQILRLLGSLSHEGTAILFVTHDLGVASTLADRVLVCYRGRIVERGATPDVLHEPAHPYTRDLMSARFHLASDRTRPLPAGAVARDVPEVGLCPYLGRCGLAISVCHEEPPPKLAGAGPNHLALCHRAGIDAAAADAPADPWPEFEHEDEIALEIQGVTKSFPAGPRNWFGRRAPKKVLRGVDLTILRGECVALVGESGSGKSTILRIAAGLETADHGEVRLPDGARPQVIFQDAFSSLTPWMRIGAQIAERLPAQLGRHERRDRVAEAMSGLGLDPALAEALPSDLSGGQCQRAVVARAMINLPRLLLCDEPISAMDVSLAAQTLNLFNEIRRKKGIAMLFITHDLAAARLIADRIAVLEQGRLVEAGPAEEVISAPRHPYTRSLIAAIPRMGARNVSERAAP